MAILDTTLLPFKKQTINDFTEENSNEASDRVHTDSVLSFGNNKGFSLFLCSVRLKRNHRRSPTAALFFHAVITFVLSKLSSFNSS